jgi:hypothetical protein
MNTEKNVNGTAEKTKSGAKNFVGDPASEMKSRSVKMNDTAPESKKRGKAEA